MSLAGQAVSALRRSMGSTARAGQLHQQQQRAASGGHALAIKPNKYVEAWLKRREDIEYEFDWTPSMTRQVLFWGLAIPVGVYNLLAWQAHQDDDFAGRPRRDFLWYHGGAKRAVEEAAPAEQ